MTLEDFQPLSPETLRTRPNEQLLSILYLLPAGTEWKEWVTAELAERQAGRLSESLGHVENAVFQVEQAVKSLTKSSEHLEGLTKRLEALTWVLIILTALSVVTPIGIEIWKAAREAPPPPPQHSAPQTPVPLVP